MRMLPDPLLEEDVGKGIAPSLDEDVGMRMLPDPLLEEDVGKGILSDVSLDEGVGRANLSPCCLPDSRLLLISDVAAILICKRL
jgi:hypothetical protein